MKHIKDYSGWLSEAASTDISFGSSFDPMTSEFKDAFTAFSSTLGVVKIKSVSGKMFRKHIDLNVEMTNGDKFNFYSKEGDNFYKFVDPEDHKEKKRIADYGTDTPVQVVLGLIRNYYKAKGKDDEKSGEL